MNLQLNHRINLYFNDDYHEAKIVRLDTNCNNRDGETERYVCVQFYDSPYEIEWYTLDEIRRLMKSE